MERLLQKNIWKYGVLLVTNKRVFVAILGAYYLTIPQVTPQTVGVILLVSSFSGFLFEIPSGYVSDKLGHKLALVCSSMSMVLSTSFFLFADSVSFLILGGVFLSVSQAFFSGTGSAFMHETLRSLNREHEYVSIMGKLSSVGFAVPIVFTVLVPFMVGVSYKLPFLLALVIDVVGLMVTLALTIPPVPPEHIEEIRTTNFKSVLREGYRSRYFGVALFFGIVSGSLFSVSAFRAPYQLFLEVPVVWYGVFFGVGRALASLMLAYSGVLRRYFTLLSFLRLQIALYVVLVLTLGIFTVPWAVVLIFIVINAFQWGLSKVSGGYQIALIRSSKFKATLLSVGAQINLIVSSVASFWIGYMVEHLSYRYGFLYFSIILLAALFPLYGYIARRYKAGLYGTLESM